MNETQKKYIEQGFVVIKNFIEYDRAKNLYNIFANSQDAKKYDLGDDYVTFNTTNNVDNFKEFLEILCEKTMDVSALVGEMVLPTYCYGRVYRNNSFLIKHKDRPACEISLTVHLWGDTNWPFCVKNFNGKEIKIVLEPGDAVLYSGSKIEHWREPYSGNNYGQLFLHYVKSNGPNWMHFFDLPNRLHIQAQQFYNFQKNLIRSI